MMAQFNIENGVLTGVVDENIEVAVIPEGVETIGDYAFCGCKSLKSVEIPNSVKVIGEYAFFKCTSLERAVISAKNIGFQAFAKCSSLESVEMSDDVVEIGGQAFRECDSLKSVSFPNSLKVIAYGAFYNCKNLEFVDFSFASLDLISGCAFRCCEKLEGLKVVAKKVGEFAFANTGIKDLQLISNTVCESAFAYCRSMERAKVYTEYLGYGAFKGCEKIKSVELKGVNKEYGSVCDINGDYIEGGYVLVAGKDIIRYAFMKSNMAYFENLSEDPNQVDNVIVYGKVA